MSSTLSPNASHGLMNAPSMPIAIPLEKVLV